MQQMQIFILVLKEMNMEFQVIYLVDKTQDNLGQAQLLILMEEDLLQIQ